MLLENIQRNDLTIYEQAQGFQMMLDFGETEDTINICRGCGKTNRKSDIKPDWCPLRSVPEKMEVCGRYPQPDGIVPSYKIGWNECVDKILKIGEVQDESKITGCNEI